MAESSAHDSPRFAATCVLTELIGGNLPNGRRRSLATTAVRDPAQVRYPLPTGSIPVMSSGPVSVSGNAATADCCRRRTATTAPSPGLRSSVEQSRRRQRDRRDVVGERPEQVSLDGGERAPRQPDGVGHRPQVATPSVRSLASIAASVPVPIAIPTSAVASAAASLTPSPVAIATAPSSRSRVIVAAFRSGRTSAITRSMPTSRATAVATASLSPVNRTGVIPRPRISRIASALVGLTASATTSAPRTRPSHDTITDVRPSGSRLCTSAERRPGHVRHGRRDRRRHPRRRHRGGSRIR